MIAAFLKSRMTERRIREVLALARPFVLNRTSPSGTFAITARYFFISTTPRPQLHPNRQLIYSLA
jgi:hypothetical protein